MGFMDNARALIQFSDSEEVALTAAANALPASAHRPLTASGKVLDLRKASTTAELRYRAYSEWQNDAWAYYDAIGEIKYGFGMLAAVMSRVRIYAAMNLDPDSVPISTLNYRRRLVDMSDEEKQRAVELEMVPPKDLTVEVMQYAEQLLSDLTNGPGGLSTLLRSYTLNMAVPGECYLVSIDGRWYIKSSSEIVVDASGTVLLRQQRTAMGGAYSGGVTSTGSTLGDTALPEDTYIARIWREHPRYSNEPESSMLSLRETCDELVTLQRMIRAVARSNMNAGMLFIPDDLRVASSSVADDMAAAEEESEELIQSLYDNLTEPVMDETNAGTVVPTFITGPAVSGKEIQWIDVSRKADQYLVERADRALDRILQGIDMPKDFVSGMANVRYANSKQIDESLYKSHIEPLALMLVDALTSAYLVPMIKKKFPRLSDQAVRTLQIWYDPSEIVTKANPSESANQGFDKYAISADAWRAAHGFADTDAPSETEVASRMLQKATLPPDLVTSLFNKVFPSITVEQREQNLEDMPVPFPDSARELLYGNEDSESSDTQGSTGTVVDYNNSPKTNDAGFLESPVAASGATAQLHPDCLYSKHRYNGNEMQAKYRAIAEAAVRGGQSVMKTFATADLIPTQPENRTRESGTGAGAKDLPPIVIIHDRRTYLLDGHHRAGRKKRLAAAVVDVDNLRGTVQEKVG